MIRQPDFVDLSLAKETIKEVGIKKPHRFLEKVKFENICDGHSVQIMHIGSYDDEPKSFEKMHLFMGENNLTRLNDTHREIYLSNPKKTAKEKLKTVLRYSIKIKGDIL